MTATHTRVSAFTDDALGSDDATGVAERIASGDISAEEAVEAAIARVETVDGGLNAVAATDFDRARRRARGMTGRARGAFSGVPTATKENIHVAGRPARMGSQAVSSQPGDVDGAFTRQFLDTGVIPVVSTTMPEFGWTATTERVGGDVTRNPWDTAYSSGGSSGGSAALVASGALPIAHGNDGGGSIRIPAAACGLVGLKPTRGRLRLDEGNASMPVKVVVDGVLTRSVRDTAVLRGRRTQLPQPEAPADRPRRARPGAPAARRPHDRLTRRARHRRRHPRGRRAHARSAGSLGAHRR